MWLQGLIKLCQVNFESSLKVIEMNKENYKKKGLVSSSKIEKINADIFHSALAFSVLLNEFCLFNKYSANQCLNKSVLQ